MKQALDAEWTKLRTVPSTGWLLLGTVALTVVLSALAAGAAADCPLGGCSEDAVKTSLAGVQLGQAVVAVLAVQVVGSEYSSGMIRTTLTAMPGRSRVLAAKALVLAGAVTVAGLVAVLGSLVAGYQALSFALDDGPTLRAAVGSVLYLGLIGLLSQGVATAVRDSATAIGVVLGLLFLFPILRLAVTDPDWQRRLDQISPTKAGLAIQATTDVRSLPLQPWAGLGVLAAWSAAALLVGALLLHRRDA